MVIPPLKIDTTNAETDTSVSHTIDVVSGKRTFIEFVLKN